MQIVPLQVLSKQQFTVVLDGLLWNITIKLAGSVMVADVTRAGAIVVQGVRCVAGQLIIPDQLEAGYGNFLFLTAADDLPYWEQFGTQTFMYASAAELGAARAGT